MTEDKPEKILLRLKWRKTWADEENDFVAVGPDGGTIGRIYLRDTGGLLKGQWSWFYGATTGTEPTARHAAKAIEDLWFGGPAVTGGKDSKGMT
jgi:hypothetical protein